jgi:non-ribosomal peptide synthetase component E (peptide arylation enzyme)
VTPFPAEFAARYRERGYWQDRPLFEGFRDPFGHHADQVALIDHAGPVTYRQLDERSARLARALLEGRVKDLINRGGEKISAEEVENLILAHPAVLNVACVPYPDPVLGERMCACVVLRPRARSSRPGGRSTR